MLLEYAKIEKVPAYTSLIIYLITYSAKIVPRTLIWQPYNTFGYNRLTIKYKHYYFFKVHNDGWSLPLIGDALASSSCLR